MITICVASLVWGVWWRVNILFILCKYIETRYLDKDQSALPGQLLYNINMTSNQPLLNKYIKILFGFLILTGWSSVDQDYYHGHFLKPQLYNSFTNLATLATISQADLQCHVNIRFFL